MTFPLLTAQSVATTADLSADAPVTMAVVTGLILVSVGLAFLRLVIGPTLPDRAVAMDLLSSLAQAVIATYAIVTHQSALLDVAMAIALISFLGTVAFARYVEKRVGGRRTLASPDQVPTHGGPNA